MTKMRATKRRKLVQAPIHDGVLKECWYPRKGLKMEAASSYIPKDNEEKPLGEDACFICEETQTIGVADGVGSWGKKGIDAGEYATELMNNASFSVLEQAEEEGSVCPLQVLHEAYWMTKAKGSSTACIVTLKEDFLHAVNIGDSGFLVIKKGKVVFQSPAMQKRFNCPYQLGNERDTPDSAQEFKVDVEHDDVLVVGTDGLFDNLFPHQIGSIVHNCVEGKLSPKMMASLIAELAWYHSLQKDRSTPYTKSAMEVGLVQENYLGGKYDDVTVVVAKIV
ncbi:probable protein phosphatase 2C 80 [Coffea arabica]|uniref:Protein phosphatase n=1 Tax=Coffea arabica TaxID=13443 RepID=A0A6P6T043_COFAR|nr:probable protein phosphatase 2C 80 [Coffea arabica]